MRASHDAQFGLGSGERLALPRLEQRVHIALRAERAVRADADGWIVVKAAEQAPQFAVQASFPKKFCIVVHAARWPIQEAG
jgi:hypothetical protein